MQADPNRSLSINEAAALLGCSGRFIRNAIHAGRLGAWRLGRHLRIDPAAIDEYKRASTVPCGCPSVYEGGADA